MKDVEQREFIFRDEWAGLWTLIFLAPAAYYAYLFWIILPLWLIAVYGISYPMLWWRQEHEGEATPLWPVFRRFSKYAAFVRLRTMSQRARTVPGMADPRPQDQTPVEAVVAAARKIERGCDCDRDHRCNRCDNVVQLQEAIRRLDASGRAADATA